MPELLERVLSMELASVGVVTIFYGISNINDLLGLELWVHSDLTKAIILLNLPTSTMLVFRPRSTVTSLSLKRDVRIKDVSGLPQEEG